jgi:AraC-like DNA-binding protein
MKKNLIGFFRSLLGLEKNQSHSLKHPRNKNFELIKYRLEEFMNREKPFLKPGYSIKELATDLHMPSYKLSAYINKRMGMNFNDYLNQFRIKYCEELIKRQTDGKPLMQQLAQRCGFHNRNSFTTAFKKFTGRTPSDYAKHSSWR